MNLASSEAVSIRAIAQKIGAFMNKKVQFEISPDMRQGDFVADYKLAESLLSERFTSVDDGLESYISTSGLKAIA